MKIKLLNPEYFKSKKVFEDFLCGEIASENFSDEMIELEKIKFFPIYINATESERLELYKEAYTVMKEYYLPLGREVYMSKEFWFSLLVTRFRAEIIGNYPKVLENEKKFFNIVLKKFDWENYIYKIVLATEYLEETEVTEERRVELLKLMIENLDVYNYIIKYAIFRNGCFLIKILEIIEEHNLSSILKAKIKNFEGKKDDNRVGRMVLYELNKSYPVIMSPTFDKEDLEAIFLKHLAFYKKLVKG